MTESVAARSLETRLRLRELAQYYSATTTLPESDFSPRRDVDGTITPYDLADFHPYVPELSKDPSLTAIAQLAAVRTNCQRSFISLIAESSQHVVAEATRTVSPFDKDDFEGDDGIILGAQSIPLTFGICTTTIGVFTGNCPRPFGIETVVHNDYICIPDLRAEGNTSSLPAIQALPPILRYYLEVPLISAGGYVIGSICVMDPIVKQADLHDVKILQDMSKLAMRHLELIRMKADHARAESLLNGLGHFIKGQDSLPKHVRPNVNGQNPMLHQSLKAKSSSNRPVRDLDSSSEPTLSGNSSAARVRIATQVQETAEGSLPDVTEPVLTKTLEPGARGASDQDPSADSQNPNSSASTIKHTFSRAANLIRQSMDLDACCFLEIPQQERYKNLETFSGRPFRDDETADADLSSQDSMSPPLHVLTDPLLQTDFRDDKLCTRLGFSTRSESSLVADATSESSLTIPASLLSRLSLKYPQGRIFEYDSIGSISPRSSSRGSISEPSEGPGKRKRLTTELLRYFPAARSLMFYPIYDNESRQLYAGYLGYTRNAARGLQKSELTYISGFTNSIMCEVMRQKSEATDNAKSDFISSISHELRSPLHGILASSQLLLETQLGPKQLDFVKMIEICARTLLDIMEHLLDYAKINHFVKRRSPGETRPKLGKENSEVYSLVSKLDLSAIVEETATSMTLSTYRPSEAKDNPDGNPWPELSALAQTNHVLPIILNISPQESWLFNTEAGSWRRIIMNLIGNSLKYTQEGYIEVDLTIRRSENRDKRIAELKVSDTGQGISADYLKHKLFTPFAQENNLSVGAGLGLSLVRNIVSALNGHIHIKSEVGVGTEVTVSIPVEPCEDSTEQQSEVVQRTKLNPSQGIKVCILGFDGSQHSPDGPMVSLSRRKAQAALRSSLKRLFTDYYELSLDSQSADVLVIEDTYLQTNLDIYDKKHNDVLVIDSEGSPKAKSTIRHANHTHLSLPIGPTRISQALVSLSEAREKRKQHSESPEKFGVITSPAPHEARPSPPKANLQESRSLSTPPSIAFPHRAHPVTASQSHASPAEDAISTKVQTKTAILLVDDNAINLRILTATVSRLNLDAQGTCTLNAMNGLEAFNAFTKAFHAGIRIPVVFMDISMPVMDGCTATRKIRAFEEEMGVVRQSRSTIIAITGLASAEAQTEIENSGFDVYLRKPVGVKTVREIVTAETVKIISS